MSAVPDLLKIGAIPSNQQMSVETGILDPVVQNDKFIRFNMKRSGFLHSNSKLVLSLSKLGLVRPESNDYHTMFPASVGVGSLIQRVRLLSGNTTIQEIDDWSSLHAYRSMFISQENNKEREQFTTGRLTSLDQNLNDDDSLDTVDPTDPKGGAVYATGHSQRSDWSADGLTLTQGTDYYSHSFTTETLGNGNPENTANWQKRLQRFQYLENEPTYQLSLQDLCPFLKQTQLPLFMFSEEIYLEITFADVEDRVIANQTYATNLGAGPPQVYPQYKVNPVESKLVIDYITYPNETMEAWAQANQNLSFQYYDYELSKTTYTQALANKQMIRNLGGAGKVINKVIMGVQRDKSSLATGNKLIAVNGFYEGRHPPKDITRDPNDCVTTNLRYNTEFLYPIDVKNDAYHFNNVLQAEGQPPMVSRAMYSGQGLTSTNRMWEGLVQRDNLPVDYFWQTFKLNKNNRINQKGIELYQTMKSLADQDHTMRVWLEVVKVAQLVNGKLETNYA